MSETEEIKLGDIVRLKSGGPAMTIDGIGREVGLVSNKYCRCSWFEKNKHNAATFHLDALKKSKTDAARYSETLSKLTKGMEQNRTQ